jgi:hypothetical protein
MKLALLSLLTITAALGQNLTWRQTLDARLRMYGHRNWVVIADSAYPLQSNPGIETIYSNEGQVETIRHVLVSLNALPHLRPIIYLDKELPVVSEEDAVGISAYRQLISGLFEKHLPDQKPVPVYHESLLRQLDEAAKTYNVLIIKTNMALPYTSVFFELRAGYWGDDAERRLREMIH